jgi:uncharacterized protein
MAQKPTMKKVLLSLLTTGLLTFSVNAQDNSLLYEVTGNGLQQPSYLFGTFHLVCPNDLVLSNATKKAMTDAQQLYLELDFDDPALMQGMMKAMTLTDGKTVKDYLSADDYAILEKYFSEKLKMNPAQMSRMTPIALTSMLYMTLLPCQMASYDLTFAQMASKDKKEILGLESLDAQLAAFNKIPMEEQLKGLVDAAKKPEEAQAEFTKFIDTYKSQDLVKLQDAMKKSQYSGSDFSKYEDDLLNKRNQNWIPVIEKAAKEKPTFFAFGAGHLVGDQGVLKLLRARGYSVKAVKQ